MKTKRVWKNFILEFSSVFVAVVLAFMLNQWNENRRDSNTETKILIEISNGLKKDIDDIRLNTKGHKDAILACNFWRAIANGKEIKTDSTRNYYSRFVRDYISIQNKSGYETLKSKGLEIIKNDSLRFKIISLYEYDFTGVEKFEESYFEMQFQANYFKEINAMLAPFIIFDEKGDISGLDYPVTLSKLDKQILLTYLWKIEMNRAFIMTFYSQLEKQTNQLVNDIDNELKTKK